MWDFFVSHGGQCTIHIHTAQTKQIFESTWYGTLVSHLTVQVPCLSNTLFVLSAVSAGCLHQGHSYELTVGCGCNAVVSSGSVVLAC